MIGPRGTLVTLGLLGACVQGNPPGVGAKADAGVLAFTGGSITPDGCAYTVTTRNGATAPEVGTASFGDDPTPRQLHLGLGGDPATSMAILWRTVDETTLASTVELDGVTHEGFTFAYQAGFGGTDGTVRLHEAHLCGLTPDTTYTYRVGGKDPAGTEHWSEVHHFRTAPSADRADAEVTLIDVGDTRDGFGVWTNLMTIAAAQAPDLILFSGDAVTLGQLQAEWETFFDGAPILAEVPIVSAHGNHDANSVNYYSLFAMPGDEENYTFRYGPAQITVANDTPEQQSAITGKTRSFLDQALGAAESAPWSLVMHHKPIWSASANHGSDAVLGAAWGPIFDAHHVDLVLNGHDHDYERTKPMRGGAPQSSAAAGTIYVVEGGAGAVLYDVGSDFWTELSAKTHGMAIVKLRAGHLEFTAVSDTGSTIDQFTIDKP